MFCKADEPPPYGGGPFLFFLPLPYVSQVNPEGQERGEGRGAWVGAESSSASGVFATMGSSPLTRWNRQEYSKSQGFALQSSVVCMVRQLPY